MCVAALLLRETPKSKPKHKVINKNQLPSKATTTKQHKCETKQQRSYTTQKQILHKKSTTEPKNTLVVK
jgi:hypothetical protein